MRLYRGAVLSFTAAACAMAVACNDRYRCMANVECAPLGGAYQCLEGFCATPGTGSSGGGNSSSVAGSGGTSAASSAPATSSAMGSSLVSSSSSQGSSASTPGTTSSAASGPASSSSLPSSSATPPPAFPTIHAQLTWSTPSGDLDIHLIRRGADGGFVRNSPVDDCYPTNCRNSNIGWDGDAGTGTGGNPVVDTDDINGFGPENINIAAARNGSYLLGAVSQGVDGGTQATLRLWVNTTLLGTRGMMMNTDQFWSSLVFHVDGGLVTFDILDTLDPR